MFQNNKNYLAHLNQLGDQGQPELEKYLGSIRNVWLEELSSLRIEIEHSGWVLDRMNFMTSEGGVVIQIPNINGVPLDLFVVQTVNRVLLFIEDMMVYAMKKFSKWPLGVAEIPQAERDPSLPSRFRIFPIGLVSFPMWTIYYFETTDFQKLNKYQNIIDLSDTIHFDDGWDD